MGIVGCGSIANAHFPHFNSFDGAQVVAVCSKTPAKAKAKADEFGGLKWFTDYQELFASGEIEAVSVCSSSPSHAEIAIAAAESGIHVLCEKPMAQSLKQCDDIIRAAETNNIVLSGIYQNRFNPSAGKIKHLINAGLMGDCILAKGYEWTTHVFDIIQWLLGPPMRISAEWCGQQRVAVDPMIAMVMFENGNMGIMHASQWSYDSFEDTPLTIRLFGSKLRVHFTLFGLQMRLESKDDKALKEAEASIRNVCPGEYAGHNRNIHDFLNAVVQGRDPLINGAEARKAIEFMVGCYRAAITHEPTVLPIDPSDEFYASTAKPIAD